MPPTALPVHTQPVASGSLSTAPSTNTTPANGPQELFADLTAAVAGAGAIGASDSKPGSLPPLSTHSLPPSVKPGASNSFKPVQEHKDMLGGSEELVGTGNSQGQAGAGGGSTVHYSGKVEKLTGEGGDHHGRSAAGVDGVDDQLPNRRYVQPNCSARK
jgi:hypothetical protein